MNTARWHFLRYPHEAPLVEIEMENGNPQRKILLIWNLHNYELHRLKIELTSLS